MICISIIKTNVKTILMGITVIVLIECTFTHQFFIGAIEALISIPGHLNFWKVSVFKSESMGAPGRRATCYLSDFDETWPV